MKVFSMIRNSFSQSAFRYGCIFYLFENMSFKVAIMSTLFYRVPQPIIKVLPDIALTENTFFQI